MFQNYQDFTHGKFSLDERCDTLALQQQRLKLILNKQFWEFPRFYLCLCPQNEILLNFFLINICYIGSWIVINEKNNIWNPFWIKFLENYQDSAHGKFPSNFLIKIWNMLTMSFTLLYVDSLSIDIDEKDNIWTPLEIENF